MWGGPEFRYPFTQASFFEDTHFAEIDSYCLVGPAEDLLAFGQIYERHGRINFARLVVAPDRRRQGIGKRLIALLMEKGRQTYSLEEYSLYVCEDNEAAKACYAEMGFEEHVDSPDQELDDSISYMIRPV